MPIPVMVVDDNKTDRYILRRRLSRADQFDLVAEFSSGDRFLESFFEETHQVDGGDPRPLILLDINMPRMSGFETVGEIENLSSNDERQPTCVVMMCTTSESAEDRAEAARHPLIRGYFVKPITARDVEEIRGIYQRWSEDGDGHDRREAAL